MQIIQSSDDKFQQDVVSYSGITIVDFYADWCGPCKVLKEYLEKYLTEIDAEGNPNKVQVVEINIDEYPSFMTSHGVTGLPTIVFYKDGELKRTEHGAKSKQAIKEIVEEIAAS